MVYGGFCALWWISVDFMISRSCVGIRVIWRFRGLVFDMTESGQFLLSKEILFIPIKTLTDRWQINIIFAVGGMHWKFCLDPGEKRLPVAEAAWTAGFATSVAGRRDRGAASNTQIAVAVAVNGGTMCCTRNCLLFSSSLCGICGLMVYVYKWARANGHVALMCLDDQHMTGTSPSWMPGSSKTWWDWHHVAGLKGSECLMDRFWPNGIYDMSNGKLKHF